MTCSKYVDGYLKWILAEKSKVAKHANSRIAEERKILKGVLGALMTYLYENSPEFARNIDLFEDSATLSSVLHRMLKRQSSRHYLLTLFLKGKGKIRSIQTVYSQRGQTIPDNNARLSLPERKLFMTLYGGTYSLPAGHALLRLNKSLPKASKLQLKDTFKECLSDDEFICPIRVKQWLIPALMGFWEALDESTIEGYEMKVVTRHHRDGLSVMLGCATINDHESMSIALNIQLAVLTAGCPVGLHIQQPLPRGKQFAEIGPEILKSMRTDFEMGRLGLVYTSTMPSAPKSLEDDGVKKRESRLQKARREAAEEEERLQRRLWTVDTGEIEDRMLSECTYHPGLENLTRAMVLYNTLSKTRITIFPELSPAMQRTSALWLVKKREPLTRKLADWFLALCETLLSVAKSSHLPSFCQSNVNVANGFDCSEEQIENLSRLVEVLKYYEADAVEELLGINPNELKGDLDNDEFFERENETGSGHSSQSLERFSNVSEYELKKLAED